MKVIKSGLIDSEDTLVRLGIVDFGRNNDKLFDGPHNAIRLVSLFCVKTMSYTVLEQDLEQYEAQPGMPDWHHIGVHEGIGRRYWNMFKTHFPSSVIEFHDSPDFSGELREPHMDVDFAGDIGTVSASAFLDSLRHMLPGDLWISIVSDKMQVILEAHLSHPLLSKRYQTNLLSGSNREISKSWEHFVKDYGYDINWSEQEYGRIKEAYLSQRADLRKRMRAENADPFAIQIADFDFYWTFMHNLKENSGQVVPQNNPRRSELERLRARVAELEQQLVEEE